MHTKYDGKGGFPISSLLLRLAAAIAYGDWNILLTEQLGPQGRMMIHRRIEDRLSTLAGFLRWDADPYIVLTNDGRLVWVVDGYLTSDAHPYSRAISIEGMGSLNYIRNSVKATVDAYDGTVRLYVFNPADPLVRAYRNLFPGIFSDMAAMPADLRAHFGIRPKSGRPQQRLHLAARDPAHPDAEHDGGHQDHRDQKDEGDGISWRGSVIIQRGHAELRYATWLSDNHEPLSELLTTASRRVGKVPSHRNAGPGFRCALPGLRPPLRGPRRYGRGMTWPHALQVRNSSLSKKRA